ELSNLGFLPLLYIRRTDHAAFLGAQSCQKPPKYFDPSASARAQQPAKLDCLLCAARFAHGMQRLVHEHAAGSRSAGDLEERLNAWLGGYVLVGWERASDEERARRPLSAARVQVREVH